MRFNLRRFGNGTARCKSVGYPLLPPPASDRAIKLLSLACGPQAAVVRSQDEEILVRHFDNVKAWLRIIIDYLQTPRILNSGLANWRQCEIKNISLRGSSSGRSNKDMFYEPDGCSPFPVAVCKSWQRRQSIDTTSFRPNLAKPGFRARSQSPSESKK